MNEHHTTHLKILSMDHLLPESGKPDSTFSKLFLLIKYEIFLTVCMSCMSFCTRAVRSDEKHAYQQRCVIACLALALQAPCFGRSALSDSNITQGAATMIMKDMHLRGFCI